MFSRSRSRRAASAVRFRKWPVAARVYFSLARDETFRAALVRTMIFAIPVPLIEIAVGFFHRPAPALESTRRGMDTRRHPTALDDAAYDGRDRLEAHSCACRRLARWRSSQNRPARAADWFLGTMPWAFLSVAVADIWQWTPFVAILCYAALQGLPEDIVEAARRRRLPFEHSAAHYTADACAYAAGNSSSSRRHRLQAFRPRLWTDLRWPGLRHDRGRLPSLANRARAIRHRPCLSPTIIFAILVSLVTLPLTWLHRYSEAHAGMMETRVRGRGGEANSRLIAARLLSSPSSCCRSRFSFSVSFKSPDQALSGHFLPRDDPRSTIGGILFRSSRSSATCSTRSPLLSSARS